MEPVNPGQYAYVSTPKVELYVSGCTRHLSPNRADFENYVEITPKSFLAANKQTFSASMQKLNMQNTPQHLGVAERHNWTIVKHTATYPLVQDRNSKAWQHLGLRQASLDPQN